MIITMGHAPGNYQAGRGEPEPIFGRQGQTMHFVSSFFGDREVKKRSSRGFFY